MRARARSASVEGKSTAAPNCSAAWRKSRRWRAGGSAARRVTIEGKAIAGGSATAPHRAAVQQQLRCQASQFSLPPGLLVAGQLGHLRQVLAQLRVPALQQRQQLVADAVAGEGEVTVGGVLAPALAQRAEISLDFSPRGGEQRTQDAALGKLDHRVNAAQALGPGSAQKFGQDGLGLVVAGVRRGHRLHLARGHQLPEPAVTQAARSLLDGFGVFLGRCSGIHPRLVEGQTKLGRQRARKGQVAVGLLAAQAVVQMGGVQHQAQLPAPLRQSAQQGHGVGSAREAHGQAQSRLEQRVSMGSVGAACGASQNDKAAMRRRAEKVPRD